MQPRFIVSIFLSILVSQAVFANDFIYNFFPRIFLADKYNGILMTNYLKDVNGVWEKDEAYKYSTKSEKPRRKYFLMYYDTAWIREDIIRDNFINSLKDTILIKKFNSGTTELRINIDSQIYLEIVANCLPDQGCSYDTIFSEYNGENNIIKTIAKFTPKKIPYDIKSYDLTTNNYKSTISYFNYNENKQLTSIESSSYLESDALAFNEKIMYEYYENGLPARTTHIIYDPNQTVIWEYKNEYAYLK
jgi:hypothetical protein